RRKKTATAMVTQRRFDSPTLRMIATAPKPSPIAAKTRMARPPTMAAARRFSSSCSSVLNSSKRVRPRSRTPAMRLRADSRRLALMSGSSFPAKENADDQAYAGGDADCGPGIRAHLVVQLGARAAEMLARDAQRFLGTRAHFLDSWPGLVGRRAQQLLCVGDDGLEVVHHASLGGFHPVLPRR